LRILAQMSEATRSSGRERSPMLAQLQGGLGCRQHRFQAAGVATD